MVFLTLVILSMVGKPNHVQIVEIVVMTGMMYCSVRNCFTVMVITQLDLLLRSCCCCWVQCNMMADVVCVVVVGSWWSVRAGSISLTSVYIMICKTLYYFRPSGNSN